MSQLKLVITATDDVMLLPRLLQVCSRRGYRLVELSSTALAGGQRRYTCWLQGDQRWRASLPKLIAKLPYVEGVEYA